MNNLDPHDPRDATRNRAFRVGRFVSRALRSPGGRTGLLLAIGWLGGWVSALLYGSWISGGAPRDDAAQTPVATAPQADDGAGAGEIEKTPPPVDREALLAKIRDLPPAPVPADVMVLTLRPNLPTRTWKNIAIHHTATARGNPDAIDRYHRVDRKMPNGLAYHFLIGNGQGFEDGKIHASRRWREQLNGGHIRGDAANEVSLGIALVGNFEEAAPTDKQIAALKGLLRELFLRTGLQPSDVHGHNTLPGQKTVCPGRYCPIDALIAACPPPPPPADTPATPEAPAPADAPGAGTVAATAAVRTR